MRSWLLAMLLWPGIAMAADLRVLTAGAYRGILAELAPAFEARTGHHLVIANDTAGGIARRLAAGEAVDVVILPPAAIAALGPGAGPPHPLARVGIGVAVPAGAALPDIATPGAVRAAILAARAPAWIDPASGGSSGIYLAALFERWGIASQLAGRAVLVQGGLVADKLRTGEADLGLQQMTELAEGPGVTLVGPLPAAIQSFTDYAGALTATTREPAAATTLLDALAGPDADAALQRRGVARP